MVLVGQHRTLHLYKGVLGWKLRRLVRGMDSWTTFVNACRSRREVRLLAGRTSSRGEGGEEKVGWLPAIPSGFDHLSLPSGMTKHVATTAPPRFKECSPAVSYRSLDIPRQNPTSCYRSPDISYRSPDISYRSQDVSYRSPDISYRSIRPAPRKPIENVIRLEGDQVVVTTSLSAHSTVVATEQEGTNRDALLLMELLEFIKDFSSEIPIEINQ